ncbi:hypothetical protein [uncultured Methanomethylovorans sp.]|nr:hypothetical protein [uncultured Methanomethylovorans sp.]
MGSWKKDSGGNWKSEADACVNRYRKKGRNSDAHKKGSVFDVFRD